MKTKILVASLFVLLCSCTNNNSKGESMTKSSSEHDVTYKESPSTLSNGPKTDFKENNTKVESNTSSNSNSYDPGFTSGSYEQGMYDGLTDGAEDAIEGRPRKYKYKDTGLEYKSGYREGYDNAYNEGIKVTEEAEKEYERLSSEYGLDDLDY